MAENSLSSGENSFLVCKIFSCEESNHRGELAIAPGNGQVTTLAFAEPPKTTMATTGSSSGASSGRTTSLTSPKENHDKVENLNHLDIQLKEIRVHLCVVQVNSGTAKQCHLNLRTSEAAARSGRIVEDCKEARLSRQQKSLRQTDTCKKLCKNRSIKQVVLCVYLINRPLASFFCLIIANEFKFQPNSDRNGQRKLQAIYGHCSLGQCNNDRPQQR